MFGNKDYNSLFRSINCNNIYVLRGNHDNVEKLKAACLAHNIKYMGWRENVEINGKLCVLSHEPILSWDSIGRDSYHFYGHVHDNIRTGTTIIHKYYNSTVSLAGDLMQRQLSGAINKMTYTRAENDRMKKIAQLKQGI